MAQIDTVTNDVLAYTETTGAIIPGEPGKGALLANSTNYYFILGDTDAMLSSIQVKWGTAFVGTFTIETTNFTIDFDGQTNDLSNWDPSANNNWVLCNTPTAQIDMVGGGITVSAATVAVTAAGGSAVFHLGNVGTRRIRLKAAVTTGDYCRVATHAKD